MQSSWKDESQAPVSPKPIRTPGEWLANFMILCPPVAPTSSGMGEQSHIHRHVGSIRWRGQTTWNGKNDCTANLYVWNRTGGKGRGNEKWISQIEIPNAPVLLLFYECVCVHVQTPWECWRSECQDVDPYVLSVVGWWSESLGILSCIGKECPADGSCALINHHHWLLTLNVLAPTQYYTYIPLFHHTTIACLMP